MAHAHYVIQVPQLQLTGAVDDVRGRCARAPGGRHGTRQRRMTACTWPGDHPDVDPKTSKADLPC